ncbi:MAG: S1 family peptidase [Myxococcota bacterium]
MPLLATLALLAYSSAPAPAPTEFAPEDRSPHLVVGGQPAPECGWPSTVQMATSAGEPFCTGTLIDARTVLTAAHCLDPSMSAWTAGQIFLGESAFAPQAAVPVQECAIHPGWDVGTGQPGQSFFYDLAVCTLAEDAPDVPIVPPLMGCEADILAPGQEMMIVGFGYDNEAQSSGLGTKRWTAQTVQTVDLVTNDLTLLGVNGGSACFGDSGGPIFVQLADGSWRVAGVTSTAHPDVWDQPLLCGYGVVYDLIHTEMAWFEDQTGRDLTPCHDADGTWNPDERCDALPMQLTPPGTAWANLCQGGMISGPGASCGDPIGEPPPDTDGSEGSTGEPPDGGTGEGTDSGGRPEPTSGTLGATDGEPPDAESGDLPGGTGQSLPDWPPSDGDDGGGCGCRHRSSDDGTPWAWLALGLGLGLRRVRRRRRSTSSG